MSHEVTILFAGTRGYLDEFPLDSLAKYEEGLYAFIESRYPQIFAGLKEKEAFTDEIETMLTKALKEYGEEFKDTIK